MKAIPVPVRERILHLYNQGQSPGELAASLGYGVAAVRRVRQHFKTRGTLAPQTHRCGRKPLLTARRRERLQTLVAQQPDLTLAELGARFKRPTSTMALWRNRLGWSCKIRYPPPRRRGPPWWSKEGRGPSGWRACPRRGWCAWMNAGPTRQCPGVRGAARLAGGWSAPCRRAMISRPP